MPIPQAEMSIRSAVQGLVVCLAGLTAACGGDAGGAPEDLGDANVVVGDAGGADDVVVTADGGVLPNVWVVGAEDASTDTDAGAVEESDASVAEDAGDEVPDAETTPDSGTEPGCALVFYRDADADGFGDPAASVTACAKPAGYVTDKTDCYDANKNAKPGQTGRFSVHRGDGSFDYDCDGALNPRDSRVGQCPADIATAKCPPWPYQPAEEHCDYDAQVAPWRVVTEGWYQQVAACGEVALYSVQLNWDNVSHTYSCSAPTTTQRQTCR